TASGSYQGTTVTTYATMTPTYNKKLLMVVPNTASLSNAAKTRKQWAQNWGWTVSLINYNDTPVNFATACGAASAVWVISESASIDLDKTGLKDQSRGMVLEVAGIDKMQLSDKSSQQTNTSTITVSDNTHYITEVFPAGTLTITSSVQPGSFMK